MRLLLVIPKLVSYRSFLHELCLALVAKGAEVHLACSAEKLWSEEGPPVDEGVHMHVVEFARGMNPGTHLRAARALDRLVRDLKPDIVHAHFSAAIFTTALAHARGWPPTFATFHGVAFPAMRGRKGMLLRAAETWAARRFDTVWVLTDDDQKSLSAAAPRTVVRRLPGFGVGCDVEKFAAASRNERPISRQKLGITASEVAFVFVGRFVHFKGFGRLARAFLRLSKSAPDVRLILIGARDQLHPTGLSETEEQALEASERVTDVGYCNDVEHFLAAADVMVFPSSREGMPVCAMEALASGIPVITADSRGCRDVVRDGVDGLVLPDGDEEELLAAMRRVAGDEALRRTWSANASEGRGRFSRAHFVSTQMKIYEEFKPLPALGIEGAKLEA